MEYTPEKGTPLRLNHEAHNILFKNNGIVCFVANLYVFRHKIDKTDLKYCFFRNLN